MIKTRMDTTHADDADVNQNITDLKLVKRGITRLYKFRREYGKPGGIKIKVTFDALNKIENKETKADEETPRGIMWLKGRVNKDGEFTDDEIIPVGDKLKEADDKIKEGTLNLDDGTDAMTVVFGKEKEVMQEEWEVEFHTRAAQGVQLNLSSQLQVASDVTPIGAYEVDGTQSSVVVRDKDVRIQKKSNGLVTSEKVSIDSSLVDATCIPNVGNNGLKIVKDSVGGFFAWPKNQVVLDEEVTPPTTIQKISDYNSAPKLQSKRKNYVSRETMQRQARTGKSHKSLNYGS
ncbi:hypothetical protein Tco_0242808 [Tanacetum coccineum]